MTNNGVIAKRLFRALGIAFFVQIMALFIIAARVLIPYGTTIFVTDNARPQFLLEWQTLLAQSGYAVWLLTILLTFYVFVRDKSFGSKTSNSLLVMSRTIVEPFLWLTLFAVVIPEVFFIKRSVLVTTILVSIGAMFIFARWNANVRLHPSIVLIAIPVGLSLLWLPLFKVIDSDTSVASPDLLYQRQRAEVEKLIFSTLPCSSSLPALERLRDLPVDVFKIEQPVVKYDCLQKYTDTLYPYRGRPRVISQQTIQDDAKHTIDLFHFESRVPDQTVSAYFAVPKDIPADQSLPMVVVLHGVGSSPEQALGFVKDGDYMNNIGQRLLSRGYAVLVPYIFSSPRWISNAQSYLGSNTDRNLIIFNVAKLQTSLDLFLLDQRIDPTRVAVYGVSWGGSTARNLGALDERVRLLVISGQPGDRAARVSSRTRPLTNHVAGPVLCNCGVGVIYAAAVAPRPLILETGTRDTYLTFGAKEMHSILLQIYQKLGHPDDVHLIIFEGGHEINPGEETLNLIDSYLLNPKFAPVE